MAFRKNLISIQPPLAKYAYSVSIISVHCSTVLHCQHIPCADPFLGCNVLCCRLFRQGVLGLGSILRDAVGVDGLTLSSKPSTVILFRGP